MNIRSGITLSAAVLVPIFLVGALVLYAYSPNLPGYAPRPYPQFVFWVPLALAVCALQALPLGSLPRRLLLTVAFGAAMAAVILVLYLLGACSYGDCF